MICCGFGEADRRPLVGGHGNTVMRLSKALSNRGHEIIIITTPPLHSFNSQFRIVNLEWGKIFSLPASGSYGSLRYGLEFMLKALYKMKQLHREEKFDMIHGHSGYPELGLITGIGSKVLCVPSIHTLYCSVQTSDYRILSEKFYLSLINVVISLSNNIQASLKKIGVPEGRIRIVPPLIDTTQFNPSVSGADIKRNLNIEKNEILLYIGDLTKERGLHILIEALSGLLEKFPSLKVLIAVNRPIEIYERSRINEKVTALGLNDNVIPLGIVDNMPQIMTASDIFVAPYLSIEGIADYPISLLEAMACGKPVVATKVGGIPEMVINQKNGLLIRPNDPVELVNAIIYMLNNKEKAIKMGLEGAKLVYEKFRAEIVVDELERIYEEVISNYRGNRRC